MPRPTSRQRSSSSPRPPGGVPCLSRNALRTDKEHEARRNQMAGTPTMEQVTEAAKELDPAGFTRAQLAEKLGVKPMDLQDPVKEARQAGRPAKGGAKDEGKGHFPPTASYKTLD